VQISTDEVTAGTTQAQQKNQKSFNGKQFFHAINSADNMKGVESEVVKASKPVKTVSKNQINAIEQLMPFEKRKNKFQYD
jgi:hypothetical protein